MNQELKVVAEELVLHLGQEDKASIVMQNVNISDVFSDVKTEEMLRYIRADEEERLKDLQDSAEGDDKVIYDAQFRLSLTELEIEKDAIAYAIYASKLSLKDFLSEFEGYIDNIDGYEELNDFIYKVSSKKIVIK